MLVAFGGQTYEGIWSYMENDKQRKTLAKNLAAELQVSFPVYKRYVDPEEVLECMGYNWDGTECDYSLNQLVGYVELDGLDFDFEKAARIVPKENENLQALITELRNHIPKDGVKVLSLTTYHVGADPESCDDPSVFSEVVDGTEYFCSYIEESGRSKHHGEIASLLESSKDDFDFFNVMTYDAGKDFLYKYAMANYARYVEKDKIVLGNTINLQWGPAENGGSFVEDRQTNLDRAEWQFGEGYGGFFIWALGSNTNQMSFPDQVKYFNDQIVASRPYHP